MSSAGERISTDPRLSRRRRAVERARRRRLFARASVAVAAGVALWVAFWSPVFAVRAVEVVGGRHTRAADVLAAARLAPGDNLLLLSPGEVAAAAESLPWVRRARVQRMLPGTVKVKIAERRPALVLSAPGETRTIDAHGRVLAAGERGRELPRLVTDTAVAAAPGEVVSDDSARSALRALRALRPGMRKRVRAVFAPSLERISFSLDSGTLVRFGAAERLRAKKAVLAALLRRLAQQGIAAGYVDVRVPESPAVSRAPAPAYLPAETTPESGPRAP